MVLNFYKNVLGILKSGRDAVLMVVADSTGSSPGRQGFMMLVTGDELHGTIGGGVMEYKLAELCRSLLGSGYFKPFVKRQVHDTHSADSKSGMICSGEQVIAFYYLSPDDSDLIEHIIAKSSTHISYSESGVKVVDADSDSLFECNQELTEWRYLQPVDSAGKVFIFGAGHVGLALSELLSKLNFEINLFDDRQGLNTFEANCFADTKQLIDYGNSRSYVTEGERSYVVIMSFGHKADAIILKSLYGLKFRYIGMLGSREKIRKMKEDFRSSGYETEYFDKVHAPAGIEIKSETAYEIAVSIAAEMIAVRNKPKQRIMT